MPMTIAMMSTTSTHGATTAHGTGMECWVPLDVGRTDSPSLAPRYIEAPPRFAS